MKRRTVWVVRDVLAQEYVFYAEKPQTTVVPVCGDADCTLCGGKDMQLRFRGGRRLLGRPCAERVEGYLPFLKRLPANTPVRVVIG